jgi:hypothetical protein
MVVLGDFLSKSKRVKDKEEKIQRSGICWEVIDAFALCQTVILYGKVVMRFLLQAVKQVLGRHAIGWTVGGAGKNIAASNSSRLSEESQ